MAYSLWPGLDTVIFVIRFTFHVSRITAFLGKRLFEHPAR